MTSIGTGGRLRAPGAWVAPRRRATVTCKACGSGYPSALILCAHGWSWDQHARVCPGRSLGVAFANLARWAECPPAEYIVDQELAYIKKRVFG